MRSFRLVNLPNDKSIYCHPVKENETKQCEIDAMASP